MKNYLRSAIILLTVGALAPAALAQQQFSPRQLSDQQTTYTRFAVNFNSCALPATAGSCSFKVGAVPYNTFIVRGYMQVYTAFNSTTTDTVAIGTASAGAQLVAATSTHTAGPGAALTIVAANLGNGGHRQQHRPDRQQWRFRSLGHDCLYGSHSGDRRQCRGDSAVHPAQRRRLRAGADGRDRRRLADERSEVPLRGVTLVPHLGEGFSPTGVHCVHCFALTLPSGALRPATPEVYLATRECVAFLLKGTQPMADPTNADVQRAFGLINGPFAIVDDQVATVVNSQAQGLRVRGQIFSVTQATNLASVVLPSINGGDAPPICVICNETAVSLRIGGAAGDAVNGTLTSPTMVAAGTLALGTKATAICVASQSPLGSRRRPHSVAKQLAHSGVDDVSELA